MERRPRRRGELWGCREWLTRGLLAALKAVHRVPNRSCRHPGPNLQGAVITQCYPTHYYAVHETGHRMGFRHANMYQ